MSRERLEREQLGLSGTLRDTERSGRDTLNGRHDATRCVCPPDLEFDFFVLYDGKQTEAHLWANPFHQNTSEVLWNLEIYPQGQNLQVLKLKKHNDGKYVEVFRDQKLEIDLNTIIKIIESNTE